MRWKCPRMTRNLLVNGIKKIEIEWDIEVYLQQYFNG